MTPVSRELLPGAVTTPEELKMLENLGNSTGWSQAGESVVQVARDAKSYRTPEPRFSSSAFPIRTTFGQYQLQNGELCWQRLEKRTPSLEITEASRWLRESS